MFGLYYSAQTFEAWTAELRMALFFIIVKKCGRIWEKGALRANPEFWF